MARLLALQQPDGGFSFWGRDPSSAYLTVHVVHALAVARRSLGPTRPVVTIRLPNGNASGLHFNVYTPAQIGDWWNETPIGRGTGQALNCDTGVPEVNGACQSDDLTWVGNFNEAGTYYVQVVNGNPDPISAPLSLQVTASAQ